MYGGLAASQRVAADDALVKVHLRSDQPVGPCGIDGEAMAQQGHVTLGRGATQVDQAAMGRRLQVQASSLGKGSPPRGPAVIGGHRAGRLGLQAHQGLMRDTAPHFGLPAPMVTLKRRLKPAFLRRGEDRDDSQAATDAEHPPDGIGMLMRALEAGIVVEWGLARQAPCLPVLQQGARDDHGGDVRP